MHDDDFVRTTGLQKHLYQCNRQDLTQYNHAVAWSEWNKIEATPLLDQTLNVIRNFEHIEVEIKSVASEDQQLKKSTFEVEQQLQGYEQAAIITSFDAKILDAFQTAKLTFKTRFID